MCVNDVVSSEKLGSAEVNIQCPFLSPNHYLSPPSNVMSEAHSICEVCPVKPPDPTVSPFSKIKYITSQYLLITLSILLSLQRGWDHVFD